MALIRALARYKTKQKIILGISILVFLAILPATVYRLVSQNWLIAFLDLLALSLTVTIIIFTLKQQHATAMRLLLAFVIGSGAVATCFILGANQIHWVYPAIIALFFLLKPHYSLLFSLAIIAAVLPAINNDNFSMQTINVAITLVLTTLFMYAFSLEMKTKQDVLRNQAQIDFLTKTGNRRAFQTECESIINAASDRDLHSTMAIFDLDNFKHINDNYGHDVGDQVLKFIATTAKVNIPTEHSLYRLGGEEFAIIATRANSQAVAEVCEKLRVLFRNSPEYKLAPVTASFGIAQYNHNEDLSGWMKRADVAMFVAKENGKDMLSIAD